MRMFVTEERLLIAIHEGRKTRIAKEDASTFRMLLGRGLVTGTNSDEAEFINASLTPAGNQVLWEIFRRD